jgi:dihydroorotase
MAAAGAVAFSDDGSGVGSAGAMGKALAYIAMTGKPLMQHCEDQDMAGGAMNAGALASKLGIPGMPRIAEELMLQRDLLLNLGQNIGCRYHMLHVSTQGAVEMLRKARATLDGKRLITAEATPHHLLLTQERCSDYNSVYKVNPPLRTQKDVDALLEGIRDGTITQLATDHAPHTREEKELEFSQAPFGIIGLECALALFVKALITPGVIGWPRLIEMMSTNPARLVGLESKGHLAVGADADVTIINPDMNWTIDVSGFKSKSRNCPFDGWQVTGRAVTTIVGGRVKFDLSGTA